MLLDVDDEETDCDEVLLLDDLLVDDDDVLLVDEELVLLDDSETLCDDDELHSRHGQWTHVYH